MKLRSSMIFGVILVLIGLSMILRTVFHIDLPVFRIAIALVIIFVGVRMLVGKRFEIGDFKWSGGIQSSSQNQYGVVFGSGFIDLTDLSLDKFNSEPIDVNVVFGEATVLLPKNVPFKIKLNSAFGEAKTPDNNMVALGNLNYVNPNAKATQGEGHQIQGNVVFGSLKFQFKE